MTMRVYDPDQFSLVICGITPHGYADGSFITVKMVTPMFQSAVGTDGEVTRSRSNDRRADIELKLMSTSDSNDLFSALAAREANRQNGAGVGSFLLKDRNGRTELSASECWLVKEPDIDLDRTPKERVWLFEVARLNRLDGGS